MQEIETVERLRTAVKQWRAEGESIALVPTMGNLHRGHLLLVEKAGQMADRVVVSIFVNPTQFGPGEDFESYPRTLDEDRQKLREQGYTDLLFCPSTDQLYPSGSRAAAWVEVPDLSEKLCGRYRPGHFRGVATVVCKLFNLVQPDVAVFGEKDFQQLMVIRRMTADLHFPVRIEGVPTVREEDGLALSSRNLYLTPDERKRAATLYRSLVQAECALQAGNEDFRQVEGEQLEGLRKIGFRPDYFSICRIEDLEPAGGEDKNLVILTAAWLGKTRLIDSLRVNLD